MPRVIRYQKLFHQQNVLIHSKKGKFTAPKIVCHRDSRLTDFQPQYISAFRRNTLRQLLLLLIIAKATVLCQQGDLIEHRAK